MADEITRKLFDQQRAKVAVAEAKLTEERKKLEWMESMAGDIQKAIQESTGETASRSAIAKGQKQMRQRPKPEPVANVSAHSKPQERTLKQHEILDFVDRMEGEFTPKDLCTLVEAHSPFRVALNPLQCAMARMSKAGKGLECMKRGGRWTEATYCRKPA